jgi:predicted TPR repeat methyltransferase
MKCCQQCEGIENLFDESVAAGDLEEYRKHGPAKTTRMLLDALKSRLTEGMTLLDIGGGIGAIQHELLKAQVSQATNVDASTAYLEAARREAERLGHANRVSYHHGNFVDLAANIPPADIVTLDRVICCYPDMPALVGLSSARAKKFFGLIFPRDTWWLKLGRPILNGFFWVQRNPFRFFVHSTDKVNAVVANNGLRPLFRRETWLWQIVVYERAV